MLKLFDFLKVSKQGVTFAFFGVCVLRQGLYSQAGYAEQAGLKSL